jgi:hypothetical protein
MATKNLSLLIWLLLAITSVPAQEISIKGRIADTLSEIPMHHASIYLLRSGDSILKASTRCNENGFFILPPLPQDKYLLFIKYPGYAEYADEVNLIGKTETDLGTIYLRNKIKILEEAIVKQKIAAIRVKGDTTEYKADSFYVPPNATVEELLKKLPGIQVNARGQIFAQSERVEKILVDGEEFFSDDPAVVIKNLRADYVDKVQVFDKKSDQANFTGIDDGQKTKTINLKLKEDKRLSYFGRMEAGGGTGKYYYGKAMLNLFNKRSKIAAYITKDNTNYQALNFDEQNNFSTNLNMTTKISDDGTMSMQALSDEFGWGRGLPLSITGGLVYNKRWDNDAQRINNTYQYNNLLVNGDIKVSAKNFLPGLVYHTEQQQQVRSRKIRHLLDVDYEWRLDTSATLKLSARNNRVRYDDHTGIIEKTDNDNGQPLNTNTRTLSASGDKNIFKSSVLYLKKMKKASRTLSVAADFNMGNQEAASYLKSSGYFFGPGQTVVDSLLLDQYKPTSVKENKEGVKIAFTEPLSATTYLEINYLLTASQSTSSKLTYNKKSGEYGELVDSLGNRLRYNNTLNAGGLNIKIKHKKYFFVLGSAAGINTYHLQDLQTQNKLDRRFFSLLPAASVVYNKDRSTRLKLSYEGQNINPSVANIQPLRDNTDPLNITIGNDQLVQAYVNNLNLEYLSSKVKRNQYLSVNANFNSSRNDFSIASFTDVTGKRVNKAINVMGNHNGSLSLFYNIGIGKGVNWWVATNSSFGRFTNMVNNNSNHTKSKRISVETGWQKYNGTKTSFNINFRPVYNTNTSSVEQGGVNRFWSFESNPALDTRLPGKIFFSLNGEIYVYGKSRFNTPEDIFIVNGSIKKFFSKTDRWMVMASVNDLLNKNRAIDRSFSSNYISQTTFSNIRRYFMLSLSYNFNKSLK